DEYTKTGRISLPEELGISTLAVTGEVAQALELPSSGGLLVQRVRRGSAAESAGLHGPTRGVLYGNTPVGIGGDLIVAVDGQPVEGEETLRRAMNHKKGGDTLTSPSTAAAAISGSRSACAKLASNNSDMELKIVPLEIPEGGNLILGQTHF